MSDEPGTVIWARRAPGLRVVLFLIFAASLPFTWTEETEKGCSGGAAGAPVLRTGWEHLSHSFEAFAWVLLFALSPIALIFLIRQSRTWVRLLAHVIAAFSSALLFGLAHFAATFTLFSHIRLFPPALIGLGAAAAAALEAAARALGELGQLIRERRARKALENPPAPE
ncbi:MAG: hypothetical protein IPI67_07365 [Myxococcales bacterium]|nr:hypothetical protein [Myxococcales bacterium]